MEKEKAEKSVVQYRKTMEKEELSQNTIHKYLADIQQWISCMPEKIDENCMRNYKKLLSEKYAVRSVNSKLVSVNRYIKWLGYSELTVRTKRIQMITSLEKMMTRQDYDKMISFAERTGRWKMYYLMRTIALSGIRVGEIRFITVEAIRAGSVMVENKGTCRWVYLSETLCERLEKYCEFARITEGVIFIGRFKGKAISPAGVWRNLKHIAKMTGVRADVVYPHSFRHLFAKTYMSEIGDISELADLLGHKRIETTWIYTKTTSGEKRSRLEQLDL